MIENFVKKDILDWIIKYEWEKLLFLLFFFAHGTYV